MTSLAVPGVVHDVMCEFADGMTEHNVQQQTVGGGQEILIVQGNFPGEFDNGLQFLHGRLNL